MKDFIGGIMWRANWGKTGQRLKLFVGIATLCCISFVSFSLRAESFQNFRLKDPQKLQRAYADKSGISPVDFQENNPLYQKILNELGDRYEQIGQQQAQGVLDQQDGFYLGGLNNAGFRWGRGFGEFQIDLRRDLSPDITHDERWIVRDQFTIIIEASKVLSNLEDLDVIDITEEQLGAFAGLNFRRTYTYTHFADSYTEGLTLDLHKLFMMFKLFRGNEFLELEGGEFVQKEDSLSVDIGALANSPIYQSGGLNISATAGVLYKYQKLAKVDVHALEKGREDRERLRISLEKTQGKTFGASASIQADFLKVLRLTLLSYDFNYTYEETFRSYLTFHERDMRRLRNNTKLSREVGELLSFDDPNDQVLAPHIVSQEHREKEIINSKYMVLLFSGERREETESIEIVKDGVKKRFFRHHYTQEDKKQNFLSRLVSGFLNSFLDLNSNVKNEAESSKSFSMEYESKRNLVKKKKDLKVAGKDVLSLEFQTKFYASGKDGEIRKKHREKALDILEGHSGVDPLIMDQLARNKFRAPLRISSQFEMGKGAVSHFNRLSPDDKYDIINEMCGAEGGFWGFLQNAFNGCLNRVKEAYEEYEYELHHSTYGKDTYEDCLRYGRRRMGKGGFRSVESMSASKKLAMLRRCLDLKTRKPNTKSARELPLWRLKDFMKTMHKYSDSKVDMYDFFGLSNIFLYGEFQAKKQNGVPFTGHYTEGKYRSLGIIEDYREKEGLSKSSGRSPASTYSQQTLSSSN